MLEDLEEFDLLSEVEEELIVVEGVQELEHQQLAGRVED